LPAKAHKSYNQNKGSNRRSRNRPGAVHKKSFPGVPVDTSSTPTLNKICIFESTTAVSFEDVLSNIETNTNLEIKASPGVRGTVISSMKQIVGKLENPMHPVVKVVIKSTPSHRVRGNFRREDRLTSRGELIIHVKSPIVKNEENNVSFLKEVRVNRTSRRRGFAPYIGVPVVPELVQEFSHDDKDVGQQETRKKIKENFEISSSVAIKIKKSLHDTSKYKNTKIDEIAIKFQDTLFEAFSSYEFLMLVNAKSEYIIFENNEFNFFIEMYILKEFYIKEKYRRQIYELLYEDLVSFLQNNKIVIGEYGFLYLNKTNIILKVEKDFSLFSKLPAHNCEKVDIDKI